MRKIIFLLLFIIIYPKPRLYAQISNDYKAVVVFNLLKHLEWHDVHKKGRFTIGVLDNQGDVYKNLKTVCERKKLPQMSSKIKVKQFKTIDKLRYSDVIYVASGITYDLSKIKKKYPKALLITEDKKLFKQQSHINLEIKDNYWHYRHNSVALQSLGLNTNDIFRKLSLNSDKKDSTKEEFEKYKNEKSAQLNALKSKIRELEDFKNTAEWVQKDVLDLLKNITESLDIEESLKDSLLQVLEEKKTIVEIKDAMQKIQEDNKKLETKEKEASNMVQDTQKQVRTQRILIWIILIILLSVVATTFYIDNRKKQKHLRKMTQSKEEVEKRNKNLKRNIQSAQLIQNAMLPTQNTIQAYLLDYFIFYRPQDIVSGDFYWFTTKNDSVFLAAVDCTGHGVQGAFMSMIANEILHRIVHMTNVTKPSEILTHLHLDIRKALKQDNNEGNSDGMDISLCKIQQNEKNWNIEYAGGKNYLIYIQDNELKYIKGNRFSIGGFQQGKDRVFTNNALSIEEDTTIYLFSDGYYDQLGGGNRKRISKHNFEQLLLNNSSYPLSEQSQNLENFLEDWMQKDKLHQLDDILVIGIKLEVDN